MLSTPASKYRVRTSHAPEREKVGHLMVVQGTTAQLSRREKQVLDLLCEGLTDQEIGQQLNIGCLTVRTYVGRLCEKLGARTRVQLGRIAAPPPREDG